MNSRTFVVALSVPALLFTGCLLQPADPGDEPVDETLRPLTANGEKPSNDVGAARLTKTQSNAGTTSSVDIVGDPDKPQPDPWVPPDTWSGSQGTPVNQGGTSTGPAKP